LSSKPRETADVLAPLASTGPLERDLIVRLLTPETGASLLSDCLPFRALFFAPEEIAEAAAAEAMGLQILLGEDKQRKYPLFSCLKFCGRNLLAD
jgi:hypothetical protein